MVTARHGRSALLAAALLVVMALGYVTVLRATKDFKQTDFTVYTAAANSVLRGGADLYRVTNERGWNYVYPPLFAIAMVPFAKIPLFWAILAWYAISVTLAAWAVCMGVGMVRAQWPDGCGFWLYVLPPCLIGWPLISALTRGQATVLLLWLVTAAVFFAWKGRDGLGGACLAGAVVLKVFPVLLLAYFAWRRRWRLLMATTAGVVLGAFVLPAGVLGWQHNVSRLQEWAQVVAEPALNLQAASQTAPLYSQLLDPVSSRNQSLQAVLWRLGAAHEAPPIAAGIGLGMVAVIILVGRSKRGHNELLVLCAVFAWMLLVSPVSENHYFVLLLMPLTALVSLAARSPDATTCWAARLAVILFAALNLMGKAIEYYGPLCWGTLFLWAAILTAAGRGAIDPAAGIADVPPLSKGLP